ncbi:DUF4878 domain-containing protein [Nocardioides gilvus]|uniref:DUF4878 domain-containing protein n=1 Tax=Nocardioides gilvus TaxID=1735589 RepID=UPI000D74B28C|nr:DUF4878 domain-containing protein [Nocardioides gilvus]
MRPIRLTSSVLVAPALALALALTAACSAQTSTPEEAARQVVQSVLDEDGAALCDLIATGGELPDEESKKECVDGLGKEMIELEDDDRKNMEHFLEEGAEKVEEDGDRATVTLSDEEALGFVKIDEAWYWDPLA